MGLSWKISVHGKQNADWLAQRLQEHSFEVTEAQSTNEGEHCTFRCLTKDRVENNSVEKLLLQWPEVRLQLSPDDSDRSARRDSVPNGSASDEFTLQDSPSPAAFPSLDEPLQPNDAPDDPFRVWLRPLGNAWKVRVEGLDRCQWLRDELAHRELACTPATDASSGMQTFR